MTPAGHLVAGYLLLLIGLAHIVEAKRAEQEEGEAARRGCARPDHVDQDHKGGVVDAASRKARKVDARTLALAGYGTVLAGVWLLHQAYEKRGRSRPWWAHLVP